MKFNLRKPKPGDLGWVIAMHGEVYAQEFHLNPRFEVDIARKGVSLYGNPSDFDSFIIAEIEGQRAGSIAVSKQTETIAFVNFLLVLPEFRGQGIARALMLKVIEHAKAYPFKRIRLETYSILEAARKLYQNLGFTRYEMIAEVKKYGHK